jgi:Zn2+/Cd2+-exporting ATPase
MPPSALARPAGKGLSMEDKVADGCSCASCDAYGLQGETVPSPVVSGQKAGFFLKRELVFLGAAASAFGLGLLLDTGGPLHIESVPALSILCFLAAYFLAGRDVLLGAARRILRGKAFDELFLMSIATIGAIAIGRYEEAVEVMVFYKVGEALQESASARSRASVHALLALRPDQVRLRRRGSWVLVDPNEAETGDEFMVMPGERVALDGEVLEGECFVDTSALTGESLPRSVSPGGEILAGSVVMDGSLTAVALKAANKSAAARIAELVDTASRSKSRATRMVTRFAAVYTPIVVASAAALAFLPPLLLRGESLAEWVYRALVLLVISCPCALVISVPLGYFCGMGGMARRGILVKGAEVLDSLAKAQTVVFDKTGTLTGGKFKLSRIVAEPGFAEDELLALAAAAESRSLHPIAISIREAATARGLSAGLEDEASGIVERPGAGVVASIGGRRVAAGNDRLLHLEEIPHEGCDASGTTVNLAVDGRLAGRILVGDEPKADAARAVRELAALGAARAIMLTGDAPASALPVAASLGIAEVAAGLLPQGKLDYLERVVTETASLGGTTIFVGDGINDAPALARADVGAAMGAGSDAAVEQADLVLMTDEPSRLVEAIARSRRTRRVVIEGIVLALTVKAAFLVLGALGMAEMWEAVIADVGVALLAIMNALRAMR